MPGPLHYPALLILYPFRYRDELSGKWVRARYVAQRHEIAARYKDWEIVGPGEVRRPRGRYFTPFASKLTVPKPGPIGQRFLELAPHRRKPTGIDSREHQLVCVFLGRLIVYEARKGRFDNVRSATDLLVEVVGAVSSLEVTRTNRTNVC
jgi:hypothetical protein